MDTTLTQIREALGHFTLKWKPNAWLDTGIPDLNCVLGHRDRGIPYGRLIEVSGWQSHGKTAIMMSVAAMAQQDGAHIVWGDVENSFDPGWAMQRGFAKCPKCEGSGTFKKTVTKKTKADVAVGTEEISDCSTCGGVDSPTCGLDISKLTLIQPYVGMFEFVDPKTGKKHRERNPRLSTAQELCSEMESAMSQPGHEKRIVVLDSIAALLTEGESLAGIENANMRTNLDLPMFMGRLLRRWVGLAQVHNATIILVNQLREGPQKYGDPTHTPGGNAPKFYAHVQIRVRRVKGGKITDKGKLLGISGIMRCLKNKTGGVEGSEVGYRILFSGPLEFISAKEAKKNEDYGE